MINKIISEFEMQEQADSMVTETLEALDNLKYATARMYIKKAYLNTQSIEQTLAIQLLEMIAKTEDDDLTKYCLNKAYTLNWRNK